MILELHLLVKGLLNIQNLGIVEIGKGTKKSTPQAVGLRGRYTIIGLVFS